MRSRPSGGHARTVNVASGRTRKLADSLHLLSHRPAGIDGVRIQLNSQDVRVDVIQMQLSLEQVLLAVSPETGQLTAERTSP